VASSCFRAGEAVLPGWLGCCGSWPPPWLLGTLILVVVYRTQGAALDRGKIVVVQSLLVTTIVWALPLGYLITAKIITRRQVLGAFVVVVGLDLFVPVGDPHAGVAETIASTYRPESASGLRTRLG
jgi:drug/metabolite transporter (DMT)-like permease